MTGKSARIARLRSQLNKKSKTQSEIFKEQIPKQFRQQLRPDVVMLRETTPRIFTGIVDIDLNGCLIFGKRIQFIGQSNVGKSLTSYIVGGAAQMTCRVCYTPIITWYDEWSVFAADPKDWEKRLATTDFASHTTCLCGACDPMRVLVVDPETSFDPVWAGLWGLMTSKINTLSVDEVLDEALDLDDDAGEDPGDDEAEDEMTTVNHTLYLFQPSAGSAMESVLLPMIEHGVIDLVIIDALPSVAMDEDLAGTERLGSHARFNSRMLTLLLSKMVDAYTNYRSKATLIAVNHFMQGPTRNSKEDPNKAAGGKKLEYLIDVNFRIRSSRSNVTLEKGHTLATVMRDNVFTVDKTKVGDPGGRGGSYRMFLDDYDNGKTTYRAGSTNDADKLFSYLKDFKDARVFEKVMSGKSLKCYRLLGREFKRVADMITFLSRRDIQFLCRPLILAAVAPLSARMSLDVKSYMYGPYADPIKDVIRELTQTTGDHLFETRVVKARRAVVTGGDSPAPASAAPEPAPAAKPKRSSRKKK